MWPKIKLIKAFIVVLDTCNNDDDLSRDEGLDGGGGGSDIHYSLKI